MSALASERANHSNINKPTHRGVKIVAVDKTASIISVTARIDYIQRFSKQMSVVIDKNAAVYSQLARQYLASISQETGKPEINVAFVAASSKLNDIQMRCRLIEQLFANILFDPEQSLAVSLSRLAKKNNDTIIIIVEHAQSLSLQIKYELCQLVEVSSKGQNNIHVVLFGLEQTAEEIAKNKSIFDKKTSIVDASSGKILALDHARFKSKTASIKSEPWIKISLITLLSLLVITFIALILVEYENFSFTSLPIKTAVNEPAKLSQPTNLLTLSGESGANVDDIHSAILALTSSNPRLTIAQAEMVDILQALTLTEVSIKNSQGTNGVVTEKVMVSAAIKTSKQLDSNGSPSDALSGNITPQLPLNNEYYLNFEKGYVIQITGFRDVLRLEKFISQHSNIVLFSYEKILNKQKFMVLTTKIYSDKTKARAVLNELPPVLNSLGAFLKSVSTIKHEINTVNR